MSCTIRHIARRFGLSRSTLLYYDSIGLLSPSGRSAAQYRLYSEEDTGRLEQICLYRQTGLSLQDIKRILDSPQTALTGALQRRLSEVNQEIDRLRQQQRMILVILSNERFRKCVGRMTKQIWIDTLKASGFTDEDLRAWHIAFERASPENHRAFLGLLDLPDSEIRAIRSWAAQGVRNRCSNGAR